MRVPTIPLARVSDMCQPAGDELEARSNAAALAQGGWTISWHQPPTVRDHGLFVVAAVFDPIANVWVGDVTFREQRQEGELGS